MKNYIRPVKRNHKSTFLAQLVICAVILIFLSILKISPDDMFVKVKNGVVLVLTKHTDIKDEIKKIKDIFVTDNEIMAMNPVSSFIVPAKNCTVTKGFGVQDADESGFHYGVDLRVLPNENIVSVAKGEVTEIATNQEYGSYIIIKHSNEISTLYAYLNEILPDVGNTVEKGQAIARANKENDTIYFEIKKGDTYLDPLEFIDFGEAND